MDRKFATVVFALLSVLLLAGGAFAAASNTAIAVASSNKAPVITGVGGPTSLSAGQAGTWAVSAYDPDGTYLSYSVNWGEGNDIAPSASDSAGSTATFQHTYYTTGTYTITFTVADSKGASTQSTVTVSVTGTSTNHPPAFTSVTCPVTGASVTCYVHASDPDGDPVTYAVGFGDSNTEVSGMQNVFAHTYQNAGTYTISVRAMDKYGAETGTSLQVKVTGNQNQAPIITEVGGPTAPKAGEVGTWTVSAYDPDGTYLSYSVNWGDEGSLKSASDSLQAGSTATFQHTYAKAGTYIITFTVADNLGASAVSTLSVVVASASSGLTMTTWTDPDVQGISYGLYAKVLDGGSVPPASSIKVTGTVNTPTGETLTNVMGLVGQSSPYANQGVYGWSFGNTMPCGTYTYSVKAERVLSTGTTGNSVEKPGTFTLSSPYCAQSGTNLPPVIIGIAGPTSLSVGETGTWKLSAYDPEGSYIIVGINWGDGSVATNPVSGALLTFQHTYSVAGTYTITFNVSDEKGASTLSTVSVVVGSSQSSVVTAKVSAIPTEVNQYDSVYVTGKVALSSAASNDEQHTFYVVLSLGNGNSIAKAYSSATGSEQVRVEEITLSPGEIREVSAYFTATHLGTNFAKIAVYLKSGSTHKLVASDSEKVLVTDGGIPSPPADRIILKFERGWNQVSVPTNYTISPDDIAKKCDISTTVWYYNPQTGQYTTATTLRYGMTGFWIKANSECTYELDMPYYSLPTYPMTAGWNMIGAPLQSTAIANFAGDCKITSGPWNYSPSVGQYLYSSKLEPGKGYWVKVASGCKLGSASDMPPAAPTEKAQAVQAASSVN